METHCKFAAVFFLVSVVAASNVMAEEMPRIVEESGNTLKNSEPAKPADWRGSIDTTWLPGGRISETSVDTSMEEVKVRFERRFAPDPRFSFSTGIRYSLLNIEAPVIARLPESLHSVSLSLGAEYMIKEDITLGLMLNPGLWSDFNSVGYEDVRVPTIMHARYRFSNKLSFTGGVAYTGGNRSFISSKLEVLPIVGIQYKPTEEWTLSLGFPSVGAMYKPSEKWSFIAGFPRSSVNYIPGKATEYFVRGEFSGGGSYRLHDPVVGSNTISYRDYRTSAGFEYPLFTSVKAALSGGYAFARKFRFDDGTRGDITVNGTPFGKLEVNLAW